MKKYRDIEFELDIDNLLDFTDNNADLLYSPHKCTVHMVDLYDMIIIYGLSYSTKNIQHYLIKYYPNIVKILRRGDYIEDISTTNTNNLCSHNMLYSVDIEGNKFRIDKLCGSNGYIDDFTFINGRFCCISEFPIDYFDAKNRITNNSYSPNMKSSIENIYQRPMVPYNIKKLGLDNIRYRDLQIYNAKCIGITINNNDEKYVIASQFLGTFHNTATHKKFIIYSIKCGYGMRNSTFNHDDSIIRYTRVNKDNIIYV